jgi:MoaA/NifB/PqqE/SkfB family radical SAM enzyme
LKALPPDSNAFSLASRNFDRIPEERRRLWLPMFRDSRRTTNLPWPERFIVEIANTCNLDCPMCRIGKEGVDLRRVMSLDDFRRIAAELFPRTREVRLNGLGESTIVPNFGAYLDVLAAYDVSVELITNGTGDRATYRRMVDSGATLLFSWDAATLVPFERLRRPARWDSCVATLASLAEHARSVGRSDQLHLLFTLQPANIGELAMLVDRAAEWGVPNLVVNLAKLADRQWMTTRSVEIIREFTGADEAAQRCGVRLFLPDQLAGQTIALASACRTSAVGCDRPWKEAVIRWDLDVQVCNMFNPYAYGNLALHSFERIWGGAFAQTFRAHVNGPDRHPYCDACAYIGEVYAQKRA